MSGDSVLMIDNETTIKRKLKIRRTRDNLRFYVYIYLDPRKSSCFKYGEYEFDHEPIYVGKGSNARAIGFTPHNKYIKNIRTCLQKQGLEFLIMFKDGLSENKAFQEEVNLIKTIGRKDQNKGPLHNFTDGGEGRSGFSHIVTEETKAKLRGYCGEKSSFWGRKHKPESIKLMSEIKKGDKNPLRRTGGMPEEGKRKISLYQTGRPKSFETRMKISNGVKNLWKRRKEKP